MSPRPNKQDVVAPILVCPPNQGPLPDLETSRLISLITGRTPEREADPQRIPEGDAAAIILLRSPIAVLAWKMSQGVPASRALTDWMSGARGLLARQSRERRRITLLDPHLVATRDPEAMAVLSARLAGTVPPEAHSGAVDPFPSLSPILWLIAARLLQDSEAARLAAEVAAVTVCPKEQAAPTEPTEDALAEWQELKGLEEEVQLLRQNLSLRLKQDESAWRARDRDKHELARAISSLSSEQSARRATEAKLSRLEAEQQQLAAELQAAKAELQAAKAELAQVYESHSWQVTRPLRAIKRKLSGMPPGH